jgi:hypothetical protein
MFIVAPRLGASSRHRAVQRHASRPPLASRHRGGAPVASPRADDDAYPLERRATRLTGRRKECDVLDRLVEAVRAGEQASLVVSIDLREVAFT